MRNENGSAREKIFTKNRENIEEKYKNKKRDIAEESRENIEVQKHVKKYKKK